METFELIVPQETLDAFAADPEEAVEQPAELILEGQRHPVMVRLRGNSSRHWTKKSWRVEFPDGVAFQGRKKLNLLAEWMDATLLVEKLGYDLLAAMHVPAPRGKFVRLVINGKYQGLYLDLENVDKRFARANRFLDADPIIYRCGGKDCELKTWMAHFQFPWTKMTHEQEGDEDLDAFLKVLNHTPEPELTSVLPRHFELENHLRTMVGDVLISNDVMEDARSFWLFDRMSRKWTFVPWDLNNSRLRYGQGKKPGYVAEADRPLFAFSVLDTYGLRTLEFRNENHPERGPWTLIFSNLNTRVAFNPDLRERSLRLLERMLDEVFTEEKVGAHVDALHAVLSPHLGGEENVFPHDSGSPYERTEVVFVPQFHDGPRYFREYVRNRRRFLQAELQRLRAAPPGLRLEAFDPAAGWLELSNPGQTPVDLTGMGITTNLRDPMTRNLPSRTLAPGESLRLTAAQLGLTFAPEGEVGLFDGLSATGALDVLFYGPLPAGRAYARSSGDIPRWEVR